MIPAKVMSKEQVQRYRKTDKLLLFLRRKYPTLAERIESGPLGGYLAQTLQDRHFPKVREFVRKLYGVEDTSEIPLLYFWREVHGDKKAQQTNKEKIQQKGHELKGFCQTSVQIIYSEPLTLRNIVPTFLDSIGRLANSLINPLIPRIDLQANYIPELDTIHLPRAIFLTLFPFRIKAHYAHECTHYFVDNSQKSVLEFYYSSSDPEKFLIARICNEGLAVYSEVAYSRREHVPGESFQDTLVSKYLFNAPENLFAFLSSILTTLRYGGSLFFKLSGYLKSRWLTKEQVVSALENGDRSLQCTIDPYTLGHRFIDDLTRLGLTTQQVFALVTSQLPTIREIFYPEQYVDRMKKEGFIP